MSSPPPLTEESLVQMRLAHLNMIQGVISRLSGFSAAAKNFCITVLAALVAVAFQKPMPELVWAGVAVPLLFALLDAYYLAQEKRFRDLYEATCSAPLTHGDDMSLKPRPLNAKRVLGAIFSWSVLGVYSALMVGMSVLLYIASHGQSERSSDEGDRRSAGQAAATAPAKPPLVADRRAAQPASASDQKSIPDGKPPTAQ
jgi:hypothetical protein